MLRSPARFDTLLRVRQLREDMKAQSLAEARLALRNANAQRESIIEQQRLALESAGNILRQEFDASEVRRYYQHERHLAQLAVEKDSEIRQCETEIERRRSELEKAMQLRRVVERVRDRRTAAWAKERRRKEQLALDEIAVNRAAMRAGFHAPSAGDES